MPRRQLDSKAVPLTNAEYIASRARADGTHSRKRLGPQLVNENEPAVDWPEYPRIEPGNYPAYCKRGHWYWEPGFKRWTCILLFDISTRNLQSSLGTIPMWLNGGNGNKPQAGRRTRYLREWVKANGGPPLRKDRLSPLVFSRRMAIVQVSDTKGPVPYSVVRQIVEWSTGQAVNQSHSQGRGGMNELKHNQPLTDFPRQKGVREDRAQDKHLARAGVEVLNSQANHTPGAGSVCDAAR